MILRTDHGSVCDCQILTDKFPPLRYADMDICSVDKNTGILWANISSSFYDEYNPNATTNVCMFTLANSTIERCVWGPWGLADFETAYNYSAPPLYYSAVFTVSLVTDGSYHLMVDGNSTRTTKPAASATAHNTTVTCPPSGVPATPITRPTPQIELIPKMAENFTTA